MKSKILMSEVVENKERKFGANLVYYPAQITLDDGTVVDALFTAGMLEDAIDRAKVNPEDMPETKSFLQGIFG